MERWESALYQRINNAEIAKHDLVVTFENGDVVHIDIKTVLPFEREIAANVQKDNLTFSDYEVTLVVDDEKYRIPWDKIRVLTDKDFSKYLAEEAEKQAKLIGVKLKRLREKKNIKSNELAERSGITPQTISRIEKGHTDVGFSTLRKLLAAMGYTLKDLAQQEAELQAEFKSPRSFNQLLKRVSMAGVDLNILSKRIIPNNIQRALQQDKSDQPELLLNEAASYISRVFGWSLKEIWGPDNLVLPNIAGQTYFKKANNISSEQVNAYTNYAYHLAKTVLKARTENLLVEYPTSTEEFKIALLKKYGGISFNAILEYAWDLGISVIPLNDSGAFHGASWNIKGEHVIILKQKVNYHSRWIFDLLHEIYHVFDHLNEENTSIIETEEISSYSVDTSVVEREANSFANQVLFDGKIEQYAQECIIEAKGHVGALQNAVTTVCERHHIRQDSLANYLAYRLSAQGTQWWGVANSFQVDTPSPYSIALEKLKSQISLNKLNPIDTNLLLTAFEA